MKEKEYKIKDYNVLINTQNILIGIGFVSLYSGFIGYITISSFFALVFLVYLIIDAIHIKRW